ncbi:MAG: cadmium-translocating P-type ATPase [Clostridia bacterium]|nr:cadmium-translocating P-type ATPase [Clostridia bacterium]
MNNVIKISGLDCANCARELEEEISKIKGVTSATVDFMAQKVYCDCDERTLEKVKYCCNHFEEVKVEEEQAVPQTSSPTEQNSRIYGEKIKIANLCCANCARELEEELNKIEGVSATVDFINMRVILNAPSPDLREKAIYAITHFENVKIVDGKAPQKGVIKAHLKEIILIAVATALFIPALVLQLTGMTEELAGKIAAWVLYGVSYLVIGYPVLWNTLKNIAKGKIFDENFLMTIASLGAIALGIFADDGFVEGVAVMLLYQIGELLQSVAVGSSRGSISALMDMKSDSATLLENGVQRVISPDELRLGDIIMIKVGEKVPVDCRITSGATSLDMKSLNGEPLPRDVKEGDEILSGSINLSKVIEAEVIREYKNSAVAKILELVENSTAKKSKPEKFITKFAKYYTPAVCAAALIVAALVPTVICAVRGAFVWPTYEEWLYNALSFLVISCPCALVISVPLSYFGGIGRCAKSGILVKGSTCLDELALSTVAAFDKTGTLTVGAFQIKNSTNEKTLKLAAAAEKFSSHPIAAAFNGVVTDYVAAEAEEVAGKGVKCAVEGKPLLCGNAKLLKENGIAFTPVKSPSTLVYVAFNGKYVGVIEIDDSLKEGVKETVSQLKSQGVVYTEMLTGDLPERAELVAKEAGLDGFKAALLPDEKLARAEQLKEKGKIIYVADGVNDDP